MSTEPLTDERLEEIQENFKSQEATLAYFLKKGDEWNGPPPAPTWELLSDAKELLAEVKRLREENANLTESKRLYVEFSDLREKCPQTIEILKDKWRE